MNESELAEYCRKKVSFQKKLKPGKKLARKEKALAEAAAILVLRKKSMRFGGRNKRKNDQPH